MTLRSRRLADQLDAALDGRDVELSSELAPLVAIAGMIREAAQRIAPDPAPGSVAVARPRCGGPVR